MGSQQNFLVDQITSSDRRFVRNELLRFHWDCYSNFTFQQSQIIDQIKNILLEASEKDFRFEHWQRIVRHRYALNPFAVDSSLIDPGGRFNIGDINATQFPSFPALYIAADKNAALQELISQKVVSGKEKQVLDIALASQDSVTSVSLSGKLDSIINLKRPERLQPFVDLIKTFITPTYLKERASRLGLPEPELITTVPHLIANLLTLDWRDWPMQYDVPVFSQVFGQLVAAAGVEGVLYTSKFTNKDCLAIFPQNFDQPSGSFIQLDDAAPKEASIRQLDAKSWRLIPAV